MNRRLVALVQARDYNAAVIVRSRQQIAYLQSRSFGDVDEYQAQQVTLAQEVDNRAVEIHSLEETFVPGVRIERGPALSRLRGAKAFLRSAVGRLHQVDEQCARAREALADLQSHSAALEEEVRKLREREEELRGVARENEIALAAAERELLERIAAKRETYAMHAAARDAAASRLVQAQALLADAKDKGTQERAEEEEIMATIEAAEESQRSPSSVRAAVLERIFVKYQNSFGMRQDLEALLVASGASRDSLNEGRLEVINREDVDSLLGTLTELRSQRWQAREAVRDLQGQVEKLTLECEASDKRRDGLRKVIDSLHQ